MSGNTEVGIRLRLDGAQAAATDLQRVEHSLGSLTGAVQRLGQLGAALLALPAALNSTVGSFVRAGDAVTVLNNQLKLATGSMASAQQAYGALFDIAQRSRVSFTELGGTFASISRATSELGISQGRLLTVTEAIGNAMAISGGSAQSMQAALVQLGQGFASGTLRGEELNSVMEQTPRLAKAIADGLGITIGQLRAMGQEGKLTAQAVLTALESQARVLSGEVKASVVTVGQAMTQLGNAAVVAAGEADRLSGVTAGIAGVMSSAATSIADVASALRRMESDGRGAVDLGGAIGVAFETIATLGVNTAYVLRGIGNEIGGLAAQAVALATGEFAQVAVIRQAMTADAERARTDVDALTKRILEARRLRDLAQQSLAGVDTRAEDARLARTGSQQTALAKAIAKATDTMATQRDTAKDWADTIRDAQKIIADTEAETMGLTKAQALMIQYLQSPAYLQASEGMREVAIATLIAAHNAEDAAAADKARAKAMAEVEAAGQKYLQSLADQAGAAEREAQSLRDQVVEITYGKAAREALVQQRLDDAAAQAQQMAAASLWEAGNSAETVALQRLADKLRDVAEARRALTGAEAAKESRDASAKAALDAQADWDRAADSIRTGLTDAFRRAFESGEDFGTAMAKVIERELKARTATALAGMLADGVMAVLGIQAAGGGAGSAPGTPGAAGYAQMLQAGKTLYGYGEQLYGWYSGTAAAPWAATAGPGLTAQAGTWGTMLGSSTGLGAGSGLGGTGSGLSTSGSTWSGMFANEAATTSGTVTAGTSASSGSWGAAAGYAALIAAAIVASDKAYDRGFTGSDQLSGKLWYEASIENATRSVLSKLGVNDKWAEILSGSVALNDSFGYSQARVEAAGVQGTLGAGDFTGQSFADIKSKAGWVRKLFGSDDRTSTEFAALPAEIGNFLDAAAKSVYDQAKEFGEALGLPAEALAGITTDIKVTLTEDVEANKAEIAKALGTYGDALVGAWADAVKPLAQYGETTAQTIQRVGGALLGVNGVLDALGIAALDASTAGGQAAIALQELFGGQQGLEQAASGYLNAFYDDAERTDLTLAGIGKTLGEVGLAVPATREAFRGLVEAQVLTTEAGRENFAALMGVADAFASITEPARSAADILAERQALEQELLTLQGDTVALRALEREGIDKTNLALYDQIQTLKDLQRVADARNAALPSLLTPEQNTAREYESIRADLAAVGVEADLGQMIGASKTDILAFATAFDAVGTHSADAKEAVWTAAHALAGLSDAAADTRQDMADLAESVRDKFRTPEQRADNAYRGVQASLQSVGLDVPLADLIGASKEQLIATAEAFAAVAENSDEAKAAVWAAASTLFDLRDAADAAAAATASEVDAVRSSISGSLLRGVSDAALAQAGAEVGGLGNLQGLLDGFFAAFVPAAEQAAASAANIGSALAAVGVEVDGTVVGLQTLGRDGFRRLVDAAIGNGDGAALGALLQVAGSFVALQEPVQATKDILAERAGLERELLQLQGDTVALRALEREGIDATNRALYDQIQALRDAQAVASERAGLERELLQLQGDTVALRALEREGIDATNRALYDQIQALRDAQDVASERAGLEARAMQASGDVGGLRARERAGLNVANRALYDYVVGLEDAAQRAQAAADAANAALQRRAAEAQEGMTLLREYLSLIGDSGRLTAIAREDVANANRPLWDHVQAIKAQRAAVEESTRAFEQGQAAHNAAVERATAERQAVGREALGLFEQLLDATGQTARLRAMEREGIDESNRALYDQVQALQDQQAALDAASQAARTAEAAYDEMIGALRGSLTGAMSVLQATVGAEKDRVGAEYQAQQAALDARLDGARNVLDATLERIEDERDALRDANQAEMRRLADQADALRDAEDARRAGVREQEIALTQALAEAAKQMRTTMDALGNAIGAASTRVGDLSALGDAITGTLRAMRPLGSERADRASAQAQIRDALAVARQSGALPDAAAISEALSIVSRPSEDLFSSRVDYLRDFYTTTRDLEELQDLTGGQLDVARAQLTTLETIRDLMQQANESDNSASLDALRAALSDAFGSLGGLDIGVTLTDALGGLNSAVIRGAQDALSASSEVARAAFEASLAAQQGAIDAARDRYQAAMDALEGEAASARDDLQRIADQVAADRASIEADYTHAIEALDAIVIAMQAAVDQALGVNGVARTVGDAVHGVRAALSALDPLQNSALQAASLAVDTARAAELAAQASVTTALGVATAVTGLPGVMEAELREAISDIKVEVDDTELDKLRDAMQFDRAALDALETAAAAFVGLPGALEASLRALISAIPTGGTGGTGGTGTGTGVFNPPGGTGTGTGGTNTTTTPVDPDSVPITASQYQQLAAQFNQYWQADSEQGSPLDRLKDFVLNSPAAKTLSTAEFNALTNYTYAPLGNFNQATFDRLEWQYRGEYDKYATKSPQLDRWDVEWKPYQWMKSNVESNLYGWLDGQSGKIFTSTTPSIYGSPEFQAAGAAIAAALRAHTGELGLTQAIHSGGGMAWETAKLLSPIIEQSKLDTYSALTSAQTEELIDRLEMALGVPAFAAGGLHTGGMRLVGEEGPELEVTGPARYYSADQTMAMLRDPQRANESLVAEVRQLRQQVAELQAAMVATAANTGKTARQLDRWDGEGLPTERA